MEYKDLEKINNSLKSIDVKGKQYVEVNQRILGFRTLFPNGTIESDIILLENGVVTIKAIIRNEEGRILATGLAQEKESSSYINKTSFIENCETSAVGRALGMLGIGATNSIASAEEVINAIKNQEEMKFNEKIAKEKEQLITEVQHSALISSIENNKIKDEQVLEIISKYGYNSTKEIKLKDYSNIISDFTKLIGK